MKKLLFILLLLPFIGQAQSQWSIRFMPQIAWGGKNDIQCPNNDQGTRFSLDRDFNRTSNVIFSPRFELEYQHKRHHIIATVALLRDRFEGMNNKNILYNGTLFELGDHINATYRFNTYRLGYRYQFVDQPRFSFSFGATLLLRDAFVSLKDNRAKSTFENVGLAPLLSYSIEWKALERLWLLSYGDAFAVKVGRAEDVFAGIRYEFSPKISGMAGYRLLEGGSDGSRIYTMSTFHFLSFGAAFQF